MRRTALLLITMISLMHFLGTAQQTLPSDIDKTTFLLGMLEYPRLKVKNSSKFEEYIVYYWCENDALKDIFYTTIIQLDTLDASAIRLEKEEKIFILKSKSHTAYLNSYLAFVPYTRNKIAKEEFKLKKKQEGYINPYKLTQQQQQESFLLGLIIAKARVNPRFLSKNATDNEGKYELVISYSSTYYDIVSFLMQRNGFDIRGYSTAGPSFRSGYEVFDGQLEFNVPKKYEAFISRTITSRDVSRNDCDNN